MELMVSKMSPQSTTSSNIDSRNFDTDRVTIRSMSKLYKKARSWIIAQNGGKITKDFIAKLGTPKATVTRNLKEGVEVYPNADVFCQWLEKLGATIVFPGEDEGEYGKILRTTINNFRLLDVPEEKILEAAKGVAEKYLCRPQEQPVYKQKNQEDSNKGIVHLNGDQTELPVKNGSE